MTIHYDERSLCGEPTDCAEPPSADEHDCPQCGAPASVWRCAEACGWESPELLTARAPAAAEAPSLEQRIAALTRCLNRHGLLHVHRGPPWAVEEVRTVTNLDTGEAGVRARHHDTWHWITLDQVAQLEASSAGRGCCAGAPEPPDAPPVQVLAVRRQASDAAWHLVAGRPLDAALCGERPPPRRGWWDLGPRAWARPTETCIVCLERADKLQAAAARGEGA